MTIANFVPELWSAAVQLPFERKLVFAQPTVTNRNYEGVISAMGDTVNITTITDPTVNSYNKANDLEIEDLDDDQLQLLIDQGDYFAFRVNDVDKRQAAGDFQGPALRRAGIKMAGKVDTFLADLSYAHVQAANQLGHQTVVSGGTGKAGSGQVLAYDVLVDLEEKLNEADVPDDDRYVIIPPKFLSALIRDLRFSRVDASGSSETLRNGMVGRALNFDVLVSNNCHKMTSADVTASLGTLNDLVVQAGVPAAQSLAVQITETEAMRQEKRFADLVRGLQVYGGKTLYVDGIATASCSFAAGTGIDVFIDSGSA